MTESSIAAFLPGYEGYSGYDRGIVIRDDDGIITLINETDEQLVFVGRT